MVIFNFPLSLIKGDNQNNTNNNHQDAVEFYIILYNCPGWWESACDSLGINDDFPQ